MTLSQFNYDLPKELIAKKPASPRDSARLFVYNRLNTKSVHPVRNSQRKNFSKKIFSCDEINICNEDNISCKNKYLSNKQTSNGVHTQFNKIGDFLQKGDVLVLNNTKVIPARLIGKKISNNNELGRKFKILLLEKKRPNIRTALIDGRGREAGLKLFFAKNLKGEIIKKLKDGIWEIKFNQDGKKLEKLIFELGEMPLPPYIKQEIKKTRNQENKRWYQTVYAKYFGSVAAPTAGLHFTKRLLKKLKKKGIQVEYITLHVGSGTFLPVKTEDITKHKMHSEFAVVSKAVAKRLNKAKEENRKVIAVGTTTVRVLEAFTKAKKLQSGNKYVNIFIYPPYKFEFVDAMITNFHLPKSTLLMMISAFISEKDIKGVKILKDIYQKAIRKKYRFYSYGDAMLIQ